MIRTNSNAVHSDVNNFSSASKKVENMFPSESRWMLDHNSQPTHSSRKHFLLNVTRTQGV
jgi:hypothetical protein